MTSEIANKSKTKKRGNPNWVKGGKSPNPKGRAPVGESWSELIKEVGNMTGDQVASFAGVLGREFSKLPKDVTIKTLTVIRVFGALLNDPQPGLLNAFMERVEGKIKDVVDLTVSEKTIEVDIEDDGHDQGQDQAASLQ